MLCFHTVTEKPVFLVEGHPDPTKPKQQFIPRVHEVHHFVATETVKCNTLDPLLRHHLEDLVDHVLTLVTLVWNFFS